MSALSCALFLIGALRLPAQSLPSLPVYSVVRAGALPDQAASLANRLNIPVGAFVLTNGEMRFLDPGSFIAAPVLPVTDPVVKSNLLADTINKVPGIPIRFEQLDFAALNHLTVPGSNTAVASFSTALDAAGLLPQSATPIVTHTMLTAFYTNESGALLSASNYLDTQVSYQLSLQRVPLVGPGAQVQVAFGATGKVSRLQYATRQLALGPSVTLVDPVVASNRAATLFGLPNPQVTVQLVYYAPPLSLTTVSNIIPWYLCGGTATVTNPGWTQPFTFNLMRMLIPATDDPNFVPAIQLVVGPTGSGTQVVARASVSGGAPPYAYVWSGSGLQVDTNTGPGITYTPMIPVAPAQLSFAREPPGALSLSWVDSSGLYQLESNTNLDPLSWAPVANAVTRSNSIGSLTLSTGSQSQFFRLHLATQSVPVTETVGLGVADRNGVFGRTRQSLGIGAMPLSPPVQFNGPLIGWGTESPYSKNLEDWDTASWRQAMGGNPIFGAERFYRGEFTAARTDFLDLPAGDDDLLGDSADISFYLGHGNPDQISFTSIPSEPGTPTSLLSDSEVHSAWGNRNLEWLALLSCDVLDQWSPNTASYAFQRWGPAFDGLHLMLGFSSEAWSHSMTGIGGDSFDTVFVNGMAGKNPWVTTIQQAWFHAALTTGPLFQSGGAGNPAVLAPIAAGGVWDFNDDWWGVGPVGPRIRAWNIRGYFYLTITQ